MEKNHNESVLISVKKITNNEYRITNVELKKSAFISVNQRLKKNPNTKTQIPNTKTQIPNTKTRNLKPQTSNFSTKNKS